MTNELDQMIAKTRFFLESLEHDLMFYTEQANNGGVSSDRVYSKWLKMKEEVDKFIELKTVVSELEGHAVALQTRIVELQKSPFARTKQDDTLEDLAKQAVSVYQEFRKTARDNREAIRDQKPMVNVVVKCVMWRDKKLPDLFAHLGKIGSCKADINRLLPQIENCLQQIQTNSKKLIDYQKTRQTAIWKLLEVTVQEQKKFQQQQQQSPGIDSMDVSRMVAPPVLPVVNPELSNSGRSTAGTPSILYSIMSMSASAESLQALEESKVTSKMFQETLGNLMSEHEEFSTMISDLDISTKGSSGTS